MRVVTFNVHQGRRPDGVIDLLLLRRAGAALGADVLAMQEVDVGTRRAGAADQAAEVGAAAGMTSTFASVRAMDGGRYGNALLVRGELDDVEVLTLPGRPGTERRCGIVATAALATGDRLSVATGHLGIRGEGLEQLPVLIAALLARPLPRVLLADCNLRPGRVAPMAEAAGLDLVGGDLTFPAHVPDRRIDHVAVAGLRATAVVVPHLPISDHRPLVVEVV